MSRVRIALGQIDATVGDLAGNAARIRECIAEARASGADLVVFPQLALSGYPPGDLLRRPGFIAANARALKELVTETGGITVILGCIDDSSGVRNAAVVIRDGAIIGVQGKIELTSLPYMDETRYFQPGGWEGTFTLAGLEVGITIGDEIERGAGSISRLVDAGADLVVNLAADPYQRGASVVRQRVLSSRARDAGAAVVYVNRVGGQDELVFAGGSMVLAADGEVVARAPSLVPELLIAELGSESRSTSRDPAPGEGDELAETYEALTIGIRDYARKNGFSHLVLGVSGGLDSALVAALGVDALGPGAVTGVWMPSPYSSELSRDDAAGLARALGIELLTIPIEAAFDSYRRLLEPHFGGRPPDLTEENLQARVRGNLLMALSNKFGWLVLATSNKSEVAVGYSTLYGDMAGGLAPLKDVPKTLVFELARWRNRQSPVIPTSTIERPPTAELRPGQLDTDSLPPYEVLDPILERFLLDGWSAERIAESEGVDPEIVERVLTLIDRAEYKRRQAPPGIKISGFTFGVDDMMPMTSRFREV